MAERARMAATLVCAALLAGCGGAAAPEDKAARVEAPAPARAGPEAEAERLVRQRLGPVELRFEEARAYRRDGIAIVCGSYSQPGRPHQRFVAVGDIDVWLEHEMEPGQMDRAFAEYCRDGAANA